MGRDRIELHNKFMNILGTRGEEVSRVYFQPPGSEDMEYPCIRYSLNVPNLKRANDRIYNGTNRYEGIVIDYDPEGAIWKNILETLPMCSPGTPYVADNLYHFPFTIYY